MIIRRRRCTKAFNKTYRSYLLSNDIIHLENYSKILPHIHNQLALKLSRTIISSFFMSIGLFTI